MSLKKFKVIVLDFDGVIVESNGIKDKAFEVLFADFPDALPEILAYHNRTTLVRFGKFLHIYEHILHKPYTLAIEAKLARQFSAHCVQAVIDAPAVKGALEFLDYFYKKVPLYLASVNPGEDLEKILQGRHLRHFFDGVYTVESSKKKALEDICNQEDVGMEEMVFIGDSRGDYDSAKSAGVHFIGRQGQWDFAGADSPVFEDLRQVKEYLCPAI